MKAKHIIITVLALLTIMTEATAQKQIQEVFQEVGEYSGVIQIGEQKTASVDAKGITNESRIVTIKVKQPLFETIFGWLERAFNNESGNASFVYTYSGDDAIADENGNPRQQWNIWRDEASPILLGSMKNSSYLMANFDDKEHPGYRSCYAAEWNSTDDPDIRTAKLIYVYGTKPESQVGNQPVYGTWSMPDRHLYTGRLTPQVVAQLDSVNRQLAKLQNLPDSLTVMPMNLQSFIINGDAQLQSALRSPELRKALGMSGNIPMNGNTDEWMAKAMNNIGHLSSSDWHRFFGILTEKMLDKANQKSNQDLVVAAGVILDLCKNADQLDADEREVSALRLMDVAERFDNDKTQYIRNLLMLGVNKLRKN